MAETLGDWGEFRLINEILIPRLESTGMSLISGDDCAQLQQWTDERPLVITSDAAPRPLAWLLGRESYWSWGWYSVCINVSDTAAAGARPLAFTSSIDAPASMKIRDFSSFVDGMADACQEFDISSAGGNLREAHGFACHGTLIGQAESRTSLSRSGCRPGDSIVLIGESGRFISAFLTAQSVGIDRLSVDDQDLLLKPIPQNRSMSILHRLGLVAAASDNSDGVLGAIWSIAERSRCGIVLSLNPEIIPESVNDVAERNRLDPWNLFFFWGDWSVIAAVRAEDIEQFRQTAERNGVRYTTLGHAVESDPGIYSDRDGYRSIRVLRNESFNLKSLTSETGGHMEWMLRTPLFDESMPIRHAQDLQWSRSSN